MELINNHGYVKRTTKGFMGELSIEGFEIDIQATFWDKASTGCDLWLQRKKKHVAQQSYEPEYKPKPKPKHDNDFEM